TGVAFLYWAVFMAVLTPGSVQGEAIDWGREALRLTVCGLLGASVTPLLVTVAHRFPVERAWLRNGAIQLGLAVVLSPLLILVSCLLAAWLLEGRLWPSAEAMREQLAVNTLLLIFCLAMFLAIVQVAARLRTAAPAVAEPPGRITIEERGRSRVIALAEIDWIESQGNYQAFHVGGGTHLLRETSARLEARLDPAAFVRIHRRTIVALDRIAAITPLTNGDASVALTGGQVLRMSRGCREAVKARLRERA
ncbi:MAG: LytTR family DNA-binding domain-containing protein, partial [Pseudomonadota bacterium]